MSAGYVPDGFRVPASTLDALQELQIELELDDPGDALEESLLWYARTRSTGGILRFAPPASQAGWEPYTRALDIGEAAGTEFEGPSQKVVLNGDEAQRLLAASDELRRLATVRGLERMVLLRVEDELRRADGWTVTVESTEGARQ